MIDEGEDEARSGGLRGGVWEMIPGVEGGEGGGEFGGVRGEAEEEAEGMGDESGVIWVGELEGDFGGSFLGEAAIGEGESLLGDNALFASVAFFDGGIIESGEEEILLIIGVKKVEAPAEGLVLFGRGNRWATEGEVEGIGESEEGIANGLGFDADGGASGPVEVFGIGGGEGVGGGEAIGGGVDDEAVEVAEIVAAIDEFGGEPVEEIELDGRGIFATEVE